MLACRKVEGLGAKPWGTETGREPGVGSVIREAELRGHGRRKEGSRGREAAAGGEGCGGVRGRS